jgi:hypothetical protein
LSYWPCVSRTKNSSSSAFSVTVTESLPRPVLSEVTVQLVADGR